MSVATARAPLPDLVETLRHMLAVLQDERRALAGLDLDAIVGCAARKSALCGTLARADVDAVEPPVRGLLDDAARLNDANARLRNLVAGKVAARLTALTGRSTLYRVGAGDALRARAARR